MAGWRHWLRGQEAVHLGDLSVQLRLGHVGQPDRVSRELLAIAEGTGDMLMA